MITVSEVVEKIIKRKPFLEEGIEKGFINLSALARYYKKDIEQELMKPIQEGAILMALKRLSFHKLSQKNETIFKKSPEMIVRSNLFEITISHTSTIKLLEKLKKIISSQKQFFLTITEGVFETTIIASNELQESIQLALEKTNVTSQIANLSSITMRLPEENVRIPGIYYEILKALAWEHINIVEVVSTTNENTIILMEDDVERAFGILKKLFKNNY